MTEQRERLSPEEIVAWMEQRFPHTLMHTLGMRVESYEPDNVVVAVDVDERLFQPAGIVHGGFYVVMAESAASIAASLRVDLTRFAVMGMEINANHLRPVSDGVLRASARCVHEGRTTHVYAIEVRDQRDKLVCISRCTVAVRPHNLFPAG